MIVVLNLLTQSLCLSIVLSLEPSEISFSLINYSSLLSADCHWSLLCVLILNYLVISLTSNHQNLLIQSIDSQSLSSCHSISSDIASCQIYLCMLYKSFIGVYYLSHQYCSSFKNLFGCSLLKKILSSKQFRQNQPFPWCLTCVWWSNRPLIWYWRSRKWA